MRLSDYIVYVDESGDHGLEVINREYPVFVLSFCIFEKRGYRDSVVPAITGLKFDTFGHDTVVLHEIDIRKRGGAFASMNKEIRDNFMQRLTGIIKDSEFFLIAVLIDKARLRQRHVRPPNPYNIAMRLGLERVYEMLSDVETEERRTHIVFESRGKREDADLELEFRRVCDGENRLARPLPFEIVLASKKINSSGLQFADMTARPIGLGYLRPAQPNRALEILKTKLYRDLSVGGEWGEVLTYP